MANVKIPPFRFLSLLNSHVEPRAQSIEVATSLQIPSFSIIGLPGPEISEARDRIKSAIEASGLPFPHRKVIINLSPASVRKKGTGLDLAMALSVLFHDDSAKDRPEVRALAWGELGLNGAIKSVGQVTRAVGAAVQAECELLILPAVDAPLARARLREHFTASKTRIRVVGAETLDEACLFLQGSEPRTDYEDAVVPLSSPRIRPAESSLLPLEKSLERTLITAAAGAHHFLLLGPKGVGKSHALEWFLHLYPDPPAPLRREQVYLAELMDREAAAPFRRVGSQVKAAALLGSFASGGLKPGEFSLAHGGVLLADEFPEWARDAREAFREPLERGRVSLNRTTGTADLPASFVLAANGNLCPCGGLFEERPRADQRPCRCVPAQRHRYLERINGPVLDRIDLIRVMTVSPGTATKTTATASPARLRERVENARALQMRAWSKPAGHLLGDELERLLAEHPAWSEELDALPFENLRDRHKCFRIALSLASLRADLPPGRGTGPSPRADDWLEARLLRGKIPL